MKAGIPGVWGPDTLADLHLSILGHRSKADPICDLLFIASEPSKVSAVGSLEAQGNEQGIKPRLT